MQPRFSIAMLGLEQYIRGCGREESLVEPIKLRALQIKGCAFCLDMHWKDLHAIGDPGQRLYGLDAWRESPYYTGVDRGGDVDHRWTRTGCRL
jgi:AhpD family alkylhydroperoxidase